MAAAVFFTTQACVSKVEYAQVAQLVEQWTENPRVGGSNPPLGTIYFLNMLRSEPVSVIQSN